MLQNHNTLLARLEKHGWALAMLAPVLLLFETGGWAASSQKKAVDPPELPVLFQGAVQIPVNAANNTIGMFSFDISFVDQTTQTYYLADQSNKAIDVVDAKADKFLMQISATPPFAGVALGPNGVLTANGCIIATDAGDRVVSFTPGGIQITNLRISMVAGRADKLAFDPTDRLLLVIITAFPNGPSVGTLIKVNAGCVLTLDANIPLPGTNGAGQPVWDPGTQRFFVPIPTVDGHGALVRINPLTAMVTTYPVTSCAPVGLALDPTNNTLLLGCSVVFDDIGNPWSGAGPNTAAPTQQIFGTNGLLLSVVSGVGGSDEVWYNSGDGHFYTGSSSSPLAPSVVVPGGTAVSQGAAVLGVIDGTSQRLDQLVPTFNVPAVPPMSGPPPGHPAGSAHSVAANATNNQVFVPLPGNNAFPGCSTGCVAIYTRSDVDLTGTTD